MLIRPEGEDAVLCIGQASHAWISGQLARAWAGLTRREEVCLAAEQHDVAWLDWDSRPERDPATGLPYSFTAIPPATWIALWSPAPARLATQSAYAALLVSMHGIEALVRWEHPESGLLGPGEFVPLAEESGAIVPLGGWVLRDACRQVAAWHAGRAEQEGFQPFWLAVNVSSRQLAHPAIAGVVQAALVESGLSPDLLYLEVAEPDLADAPDGTAAALRRLRAMGVRISIDGATAAWSTHARGFPVDMLKALPARVEAVLAARGPGVEVVAERVEDREQEAALRRSGCRVAQGFLYAHPAPPEEIEALLDVLPPPPAPEEAHAV